MIDRLSVTQDALVAMTLFAFALVLCLLWVVSASRGPSDEELERWRAVQECVKTNEPRSSASVGEYRALLAICEESFRG